MDQTDFMPLPMDLGWGSSTKRPWAKAFRSESGEEFLFVGYPHAEGTPLVRIHSGCVTGDIFMSERCDCGPQLRATWELVADRQCGGVLYFPGHEGRGIGLFDKIRAYLLQDEGLDTYAANNKLGYEDDLRRFDTAARALQVLGFRHLELITNNPAKVEALEGQGISVDKRVPLVVGISPHNYRYLAAKRDRHGHSVDLPTMSP